MISEKTSLLLGKIGFIGYTATMIFLIIWFGIIISKQDKRITKLESRTSIIETTLEDQKKIDKLQDDKTTALGTYIGDYIQDYVKNYFQYLFQQ